jgi:hypothetical protein
VDRNRRSFHSALRSSGRDDKGGRLLLARLTTWMDGSAAVIPRRLQIPPLRSSGAPVGMTRGGRLLLARLATWMDGSAAVTPRRLQIPPVGQMTRGGRLLLARLATWMDGSAAVPPRRLRIPPVGRMTRGGRLLLARLATWMDGISSGSSAKTADPSSPLLRSSGRDDKGRAVTSRKVSDLDGRNQQQLLREDCRSLHAAPPELQSG